MQCICKQTSVSRKWTYCSKIYSRRLLYGGYYMEAFVRLQSRVFMYVCVWVFALHTAEKENSQKHAYSPRERMRHTRTHTHKQRCPVQSVGRHASTNRSCTVGSRSDRSTVVFFERKKDRQRYKEYPVCEERNGGRSFNSKTRCYIYFTEKYRKSANAACAREHEERRLPARPAARCAPTYLAWNPRYK